MQSAAKAAVQCLPFHTARAPYTDFQLTFTHVHSNPLGAAITAIVQPSPDVKPQPSPPSAPEGTIRDRHLIERIAIGACPLIVLHFTPTSVSAAYYQAVFLRRSSSHPM